CSSLPCVTIVGAHMPWPIGLRPYGSGAPAAVSRAFTTFWSLGERPSPPNPSGKWTHAMPASYWAPSTSAGRCCFGSCSATTSSHRSITSCSSAFTRSSVITGTPGGGSRQLDRAVKNTEAPAAAPGAVGAAGAASRRSRGHAAPMRKRVRTSRAALIGGLAAGGVLAVLLARTRRHQPDRALSATGVVARNAQVAAVGVRSSASYALHRARLATAPATDREAIEAAYQLRTAAQVADALGNMKGALMKIGQMASYLDDGMPEPVRVALASLQQDAPP